MFVMDINFEEGDGQVGFLVKFGSRFIIEFLVGIEDGNGFGISFSVGMGYIVFKIMSIINFLLVIYDFYCLKLCKLNIFSDDDDFVVDVYFLQCFWELRVDFFFKGNNFFIFFDDGFRSMLMRFDGDVEMVGIVRSDVFSVGVVDRNGNFSFFDYFRFEVVG